MFYIIKKATLTDIPIDVATEIVSHSAEPSQLFSAGFLGIILLITLVIKCKVHSVLSLLLCALFIGVFSGLPVETLVLAVESGAQKTLQDMFLLIGLGSIFGGILEVSGGARSIAYGLLDKYDDKSRIILGLTGLLFGSTVYFEVGALILLPIAFALAKIIEKPPLYYAVPLLAGLASGFAFIPPSYGALLVSDVLGANGGIIFLLGIPTAIFSFIVAGVLFSNFLDDKTLFKIPTKIKQDIEEDVEITEIIKDDDRSKFISMMPTNIVEYVSSDVLSELFNTLENSNNNDNEVDLRGVVYDIINKKNNTDEDDKSIEILDSFFKDEKLPNYKTVTMIVLIPLLLILAGDLTTYFNIIEPIESIFIFFGTPFVALLVANLVAIYSLCLKQGYNIEKVKQILDNALKPTAGILLVITGAGIVSEVLLECGMAELVIFALDSSSLPLILIAFLIAGSIRVCVGAAVVAMTITAGIITTMPIVSTLSPLGLACVVIAINSGATAFSHFNDSGFWLASSLLKIDEKQTLKTWTIMETIIGFSGLCCALLISIFA